MPKANRQNPKAKGRGNGVAVVVREVAVVVADSNRQPLPSRPPAERMAGPFWVRNPDNGGYGVPAVGAYPMRRRPINLGQKPSTTIAATMSLNPIPDANPPAALVSLLLLTELRSLR
jgi:hypothetical protein